MHHNEKRIKICLLMKFIQATTQEHFKLIQEFTNPYEFSCAGFCAVLRKNSEPVYIISNSSQINCLLDVDGVFSFKHSIFHCLPHINLLDEEFQIQFMNFFKDKKITSIIGERSGTEFILNLLQKIGFICQQQVFYKLMILKKSPNPAPEILYNDDEIRRCQINNLEELHQLQKEYMETEIAPVGRHITDLETKANLKQILKNQLCFALYSNDEAVAKINTNAIGFNWIQIGGVFTHPMYRHNYYAWHLMHLICTRIQKTKRNPCLFVKEKNTGAYELYKKIGFEETGKFEICYFS